MRRTKRLFTFEELAELRRYADEHTGPRTRSGAINAMAKRFNRNPQVLYAKISEMRRRPPTFAETDARLLVVPDGLKQ
jgi:hypothetical protein